jgi:hypothetical protein
MADRFPDYDVLDKWDSPSWNEQTRAVVRQRLATGERPGILSPKQLDTLRALAGRIMPQPEGRPPINTVALVLEKIAGGEGDGYRHHQLPPLAEAWRRGLDALDAEAVAQHGSSFSALADALADAVLRAVETGATKSDTWGAMPSQAFWQWRLIPDIVSAYYAHPSAWSAIGFGGPASPRGYVRTDANRRDPWEAAERDDGRVIPTRTRNRHV